MLEISIKLLFFFLELKLEELSKNSTNSLQIALSTYNSKYIEACIG